MSRCVICECKVYQDEYDIHWDEFRCKTVYICKKCFPTYLDKIVKKDGKTYIPPIDHSADEPEGTVMEPPGPRPEVKAKP